MARERTMGISLLHPARDTSIIIHRMSVLRSRPSCSEARRASRVSMSCLASRLVVRLAVQIGYMRQTANVAQHSLWGAHGWRQWHYLVTVGRVPGLVRVRGKDRSPKRLLYGGAVLAGSDGRRG